MSFLTSTEKLMLQSGVGIVLTSGITPSGETFYAYIKAERDAIEKMKQDYEEGKTVNFREYGQVLNFGPGKEPPEGVKQRIAKKYGFEYKSGEESPESNDN